MEGVVSVEQLDDRRLHWHTQIGGHDQEFDVEITEQIPDQRSAWRSRSGSEHGGVVTFHYIAENQTRIMVQMDYQPEGFVEKAGDILGVASLRVTGDLDRFKEFTERQWQETGAWRGEIKRQS
jgi:uncharacterized membrane protein